MSNEDLEVELECPSCQEMGYYKKGMLETFGKVRCYSCNDDISLVPYKLSEQLKKITEYASKERTDEWGNALDELWDYVLRNSNDLQKIDHQFLFDTCVELFLNGITFIPGYEYLSYEEKSVIDSLLLDKFDPSPHLPQDVPKFDSVLWRKMFAVHNRVLTQIIELGEQISCIEEGTVQMGTGNRSRNGTIVLTNRRIIAIGREFVKVHGKTQSYPHYTEIEDYTILTYKTDIGGRKSDENWRYLISPTPSSANIFGSIDYFELSKVRKLNLKKTYIDLEFHDFVYVDIVPREFSIPIILHPAVKPIWIPLKGPAGKKHKTGKFKIRLSLGGLTGTDKSGLIDRHGSLARSIEEAVESTKRQS